MESLRKQLLVAVIPAWNEEGNIGQVVAAIPPEVCPLIIVVDNASSDKTGEIARTGGAIVVQENRRGYGYACAAGVAEAYRQGAEVIVFLDGDYSDYPEEMPGIVDPIFTGKADFVLGSRLQGGTLEAGALPAHAIFGDKLIALIVRLRFGLRISDLGPFHAIRVDLLKQLKLEEMTYGWTVEMIFKAARKKARILEVPVRYRKRLSGESKVSGNIKASILATWRILRVTARYAF